MNLKYKSWQDVTVSVFYKLEELFKDVPSLDSHQGIARLLSILCDESIDEVLNLTIAESSKLFAQAQWVNTEIPQNKIKLKELQIGDKQYVIQYDLSKMPMGAFIDYNSYVNEENNLAKILSTFLIPKGKKYGEGYDVFDVIKDIEDNLPITIATSLFFSLNKRLSTFVNRIVSYYTAILTMKTMKMKATNKLKKMLRIRQ